jgi:spore germination protein KB
LQSKQAFGVIELCCTMLLFLLGSAIVLGVGLEARKYAWLAILLAGMIGTLLFGMYVYIWKHNHYGSLGFILKQQFGKYLGLVLAIIYALYFSFIASRVLIDFTQFISNSLLYNMNPFYIKVSILLLVLYTYSKGIEPFIRSAILFGFVTLLFIIAMFAFILLSDLFHLEYMKPMLPVPFANIRKAVFPLLITLPFGELIVFFTLLPYVIEKRAVWKGGSVVILVSTVILSFSAFLTISVLHPDLAWQHIFPLVKAIERVHVLNYIQRLDLIAVIIFIIGGFFKIFVFAFGSIRVMQECLPRVKPGILATIGLSLIMGGSYFMSNNPPQHLKLGLEIVPPFVHVPLQIVVPMLLFVITAVRARLAK